MILIRVRQEVSHYRQQRQQTHITLIYSKTQPLVLDQPNKSLTRDLNLRQYPHNLTHSIKIIISRRLNQDQRESALCQELVLGVEG